MYARRKRTHESAERLGEETRAAVEAAAASVSASPPQRAHHHRRHLSLSLSLKIRKEGLCSRKRQQETSKSGERRHGIGWMGRWRAAARVPTSYHQAQHLPKPTRKDILGWPTSLPYGTDPGAIHGAQVRVRSLIWGISKRRRRRRRSLIGGGLASELLNYLSNKLIHSNNEVQVGK